MTTCGIFILTNSCAGRSQSQSRSDDANRVSLDEEEQHKLASLLTRAGMSHLYPSSNVFLHRLILSPFTNFIATQDSSPPVQ